MRTGLWNTATTVLVLFLGHSNAWGYCGKGRWAIKTGGDPQALTIDLWTSTPMTLEEMLSWPKPRHVPEDSRIPPYELEVYTVTAKLSWIVPSPDSDLHLDLDDQRHHHMIAEIPDPDCVSPESPFLSGITLSRQTVESRFGERSLPYRVDASVEITGVGMFDPPHLQPGAAPNGIEIHPVLSIRFLDSQDVLLSSGAE